MEFSAASVPLFRPTVDTVVVFSLDRLLPIAFADALRVDGTDGRDDFQATSPAPGSSGILALDDIESFSSEPFASDPVADSAAL